MTGWPSPRRRGPDGRRDARRQPDSAGEDPLTPDLAPGPPEDELGDPVSAARGICLRALTGAPKTRSQLADLLAARDIPQDAAETVLDRFTEVGLIDDAAFARAWVSSRQAGRGLARRALAAELRAKGVDAELAAEAVEAVDDDDERAAAERLVARRVPGMRRLDRATATRRLVGMLARKGYHGGLAVAVVRQALDGVDDPDDALDGESSGAGLETFDEDALLP